MAEPSLDGGFELPFAEQIAFFRQKLNLPTERWDDIRHAAHDRAFVVAGVTKADLLADLRQAVDKAISTGTSLETFRKDFRKIVADHGWQGWTGEGTPGGFAWRTKVIYETNLRSSYAAGRWAQLNDPGLQQLMPYWEYVHSDSVLHPRPLHLAWNGLTLLASDPFWKTHFTPNGWGCKCRIVARVRPRPGAVTEPLPAWEVIDDATGAPVGIDKGWDYTPGAGVDMALRQMVQDKLINYPEAIGKALSRDINRYINAQELASDYAARVLADRSKIEPLWLGFVENFEMVSAAVGRDVKGYLVVLPDEAPRHAERSHGHDGGEQRPPAPADYDQVALILAEADRIEPGKETRKGLETVVAWKEIAGEVFRAVFEVRPGKSNRSLALISLVVKTGGG